MTMEYEEQYDLINDAIESLEEIELEEVRITERHMIEGALKNLYHSKGRLDALVKESYEGGDNSE